jgi:RNA polymerase sigma-54 factor
MANSLLLTQKSQQKICSKAIQGLQVLAVPITQLADFLDNIILDNPLIELDKQNNDDGSKDNEKILPEVMDMNFLSLTNRKSKKKKIDVLTMEEVFLGNVPESETLHGFLRLQLSSLSNFSKVNKVIGEEIIENINDDGFFVGELKEISYHYGQDISVVTDILKEIQTFYPAGVGARSIEECLILQVDPRIKDYYKVINLIHHDLEDLAERKMTKLSKTYGLKKEEIQEILDYLRTLNPRPGSIFYQRTTTNYIIPDVVVKKHESHFNIYVNNEFEHSVSINEDYLQLLRNSNMEHSEKDYIRAKWNEAKILKQSLEMRCATLKKLAVFIFEAQHLFFEQGPGSLRPLMMQQAADALDVHISTISRAVQGKYIQTLWGTYPLKYFFTSSSTKKAGENISTAQIKLMVKKIIDTENPLCPLSDQEIMERLKEGNIIISRRTVAKYRQSMGIEGQSKRKRFF